MAKQTAKKAATSAAAKTGKSVGKNAGKSAADSGVESAQKSASKRVEKAVATVAEVLAAAGWDALRAESETGVGFDVEVGGKETVSLAHAEVFTSTERFVLLFIFRKKAPPKRRAEVMELISRANYGMITGGFEMDVDGGEVRYRFGIDFAGASLEPMLVRNAILSSLDAIEAYEEAFANVMAGRAAPKQAIAGAEAAAREGTV